MGGRGRRTEPLVVTAEVEVGKRAVRPSTGAASAPRAGLPLWAPILAAVMLLAVAAGLVLTSRLEQVPTGCRPDHGEAYRYIGRCGRAAHRPSRSDSEAHGQQERWGAGGNGGLGKQRGRESSCCSHVAGIGRRRESQRSQLHHRGQVHSPARHPANQL